MVGSWPWDHFCPSLERFPHLYSERIDLAIPKPPPVRKLTSTEGSGRPLDPHFAPSQPRQRRRALVGPGNVRSEDPKPQPARKGPPRCRALSSARISQIRELSQGTPRWSNVRIPVAASRLGVHPLSSLASPHPGGAWPLFTAPEAVALPPRHRCMCSDRKHHWPRQNCVHSRHGNGPFPQIPEVSG